MLKPVTLNFLKLKNEKYKQNKCNLFCYKKIITKQSLMSNFFNINNGKNITNYSILLLTRTLKKVCYSRFLKKGKKKYSQLYYKQLKTILRKKLLLKLKTLFDKNLNQILYSDDFNKTFNNNELNLIHNFFFNDSRFFYQLICPSFITFLIKKTPSNKNKRLLYIKPVNLDSQLKNSFKHFNKTINLFTEELFNNEVVCEKKKINY